jgi:hypothetical protein
MADRELPTLSGPKVTQEVIDKVPWLTKEVRKHGHPRAQMSDVIGALIDAATPDSAARALDAYNPKLGKALAELDES